MRTDVIGCYAIAMILVHIYALLVYVSISAAASANGIDNGGSRPDADEYAELVRSVSGAFDSSQKILALGENSHDQAGQYRLLNSILHTLGADIQFVGFEIETRHQGAIDHFLDGSSRELPRLTARISSPETIGAFREVLDTIKKINTSGRVPIKVLALDLSWSDSASESPHWVERRDPHMFDTLFRETNQFAGRGILFLGGHLTRTPVEIPAIMRRIFNVAAQLPTLGSLLEAQAILKNRIVRIWLDTPVPAAVAFSMVPPDWQLTTRVGKHLGGKPPLMISTKHRRFLDAESAALTRNSGSFRISENFDQFCRLENHISLAQQCAAWLSPSRLIKGVMMRLPSIR